MAPTPFTNTVFIVTGAASGIGRQVALQAAKQGAIVMATDNNSLALAETNALVLQQGLQLHSHTLDVANKEAIHAFADTTIPQLAGRKLVLVNNAGVILPGGDFNHTSQADFEWLMNINLWGVIRITKAFYPYFIQQNEGHIVNLSSVFGFGGFANQTAYCTAKFGVRGFTEALRMELAGTGIGITCVHPGGIKTNLMRNASPRGQITAEMHQKSTATFDKIALTTPEKAAHLILKAIARKKQRLVIGRDGKLIDVLTRLLPVAYTRLFKWKMDQTFR